MLEWHGVIALLMLSAESTLSSMVHVPHGACARPPGSASGGHARGSRRPVVFVSSHNPAACCPVACRVGAAVLPRGVPSLTIRPMYGIQLCQAAFVFFARSPEPAWIDWRGHRLITSTGPPALGRNISWVSGMRCILHLWAPWPYLGCNAQMLTTTTGL